MKKLAAGFMILSLLGLTLGGCARERLRLLDKLFYFQKRYVTVKAQFCSQVPTEYRQRLKYIFVMDKSTSNQLPPEMSDPDGSRRYKPLYDFVNAAAPDPGYTYYGLVNFSDASKDVVGGFTDDPVAFSNIVDQEWHATGTPARPADVGFTNYISALQAVKTLITNDLIATQGLGQQLAIGDLYNIVFLSDGYPIVSDLSQPSGVRRQDYTLQIAPQIQSIMDLKIDPTYKKYIDQIVIHTGYYYNVYDTTAEVMLRDMYSQPLGSTYTFGAGVPIDFNLFALPIRNVRFQFVDMFLDNLNSIWWEDGRFLGDSDGDGLPDEIEFTLGSNTSAMDSDGNGVSDFIEYRTKGLPCKDALCSQDAALRDNYAACMGLLPATWPNGSPNPKPDGINLPPWGTNYFADSDKDGINDCEEWILKADRDDFDANDDMAPDGVEFRSSLPIIAGTNELQADTDGDGLDSYTEMQLGAPTFISNDTIYNLKLRNVQIRKNGTLNGADCYEYTAGNVAVMGNNNLIRLSLVENPATVNAKPVIRTAEKRLNGAANEIVFGRLEFK